MIKAMLRGKFTTLSAFMKKLEMSQTIILAAYLKTLTKSCFFENIKKIEKNLYPNQIKGRESTSILTNSEIKIDR